ncbi:MAG: hybrid sensor histidine kinase/response regulator [Bernardetiaceae bacterium]|nr:hybrid sensor histidine kinase/response regulator [Bernardetiaceae bacterium]
MRVDHSAILYIDDEASNLEVFEAQFKADYTLFTAQSGTEGMRLLTEHREKIAVIITDQRMPDMSGMEFLKHMREVYPDKVRILLTAYNDWRIISRAINDCDIYRYVSKPWDSKELRFTINKAIENYLLKKENQKLIEDLRQTNVHLEGIVSKRTAEVEAQNQKLQELNEEKTAIVNMVAHDLKSPLNRIKGFSQLIPLVGELNEEQKLYLTQINEVCNDASSMIQRFLDINAIESKTKEVKLVPIELSALLRHIIKGYHEQAHQKDIQMHFHSDASKIYIQGDEEYLNRIFDNLLSNALKFSPEGRNIYIRIELKNPESEVEVHIKDEGPGLSDSDKEKLFRKYQVLSAKPTGNESSTGLGLSIVKTLLSRIEASIIVESERGKGTDFITFFQPYTDIESIKALEMQEEDA